MALPFPGKDAVPFTPLTAQFLDEMIANDEALSAGTGLNDGAVTASKLNFGSFTVIQDIEFTPSGAGDWRTVVTLDLSAYPNGARLEINIVARTALTGGGFTSIGLRLSGTTTKASLLTLNSGSFGTLNHNRIITKSATVPSIQILGTWSSENAGWYSVKRVG